MLLDVFLLPVLKLFSFNATLSPCQQGVAPEVHVTPETLACRLQCNRHVFGTLAARIYIVLLTFLVGIVVMWYVVVVLLNLVSNLFALHSHIVCRVSHHVAIT